MLKSYWMRVVERTPGPSMLQNAVLLCMELIYKEKMIKRAAIGAITEGVEEQTHFLAGSVAKLPYLDAFFDSAISLLVGCNLPNSIFQNILMN